MLTLSAYARDRKFRLRIRELRDEAGLSLRHVAARVGVDFSYLSKIENGVLPPPSEAVIARLAEVLQTDKDGLMGLAEKVPADLLRSLKERATLEFGPKVRALRIKAKLTQRELAERVGIDATYLSKIETRVKPPPTKKLILRLAQTLSVDKHSLLKLAGSPTP